MSMLKRLPKTLLPKTLWGQLISLLMLALLVSQAVTLAVFIDNRRSLTETVAQQQFVAHIVRIVNQYSEQATGVRPTNEFLRAANTNVLRFKAGPTKPLEKDDHPYYTEPLKKAILAKLNNKQYVVEMKALGQKDIIFSKDKMPLKLVTSIQVLPNNWITIDKKTDKTNNDWIWPLLMTMAMMMLFIVLIISWVVKKITSPLAELATAAQNLGLGRDVAEITETGAEDIRRVTRSFNEMNKKIKRFVNDRTKLLAAISHDLRTPITALLFRTEFIEDKEMQAKFFETLEEMQVMTEATLSFSNDSHSDEKTKNIDLKSLLDTLVSDYSDMGENVSLLFNSHYQQIILPIRVQSIKRALRNFIDNGIKYGHSVQIEFKVNSDKNIVEICFRDEGEGIDPSEFEQVFEPFYRIEKSRNKETGGVGLGLSISRGIIRGHGGDVVLSNLMEDNKISGLEVKVILPLK